GRWVCTAHRDRGHHQIAADVGGRPADGERILASRTALIGSAPTAGSVVPPGASAEDDDGQVGRDASAPTPATIGRGLAGVELDKAHRDRDPRPDRARLAVNVVVPAPLRQLEGPGPTAVAPAC